MEIILNSRKERHVRCKHKSRTLMRFVSATKMSTMKWRGTAPGRPQRRDRASWGGGEGVTDKTRSRSEAFVQL